MAALDPAPAGARNQLPDPLTSFVGRGPELQAIRRALRANRLITLVGAGGAGKTRLALHVADDERGRFPEGVWWVDLALVADAAAVPDALAAALGLRATSLATVCATLADSRALVVLDDDVGARPRPVVRPGSPVR